MVVIKKIYSYLFWYFLNSIFSTINKFISSCIPLYTGNKLTKDDYVNAAKILKCEVAAIKAVAKTESSARGAFQDY